MANKKKAAAVDNKVVVQSLKVWHEGANYFMIVSRGTNGQPAKQTRSGPFKTVGCALQTLR